MYFRPQIILLGEYSMAQAMELFLRKSRLKGNIQALQIEDVWENIMGKTIAKYTDKLQIINQTLFIHTTVAPLRNELVFQRERIIQLVNESMGSQVIREVVIQ